MKNTIIAFALSFCTLSQALQAYTRIEDRSELKVETPSLSERKTAKLRLDNGLEAYLISDPSTPQSGAALCVGVGSWDDPKERSGMAHFVEHMLFLGTEKFPDEEGYCRYLDEHGGKRNAFTASDRTVFSFSVNNEGFQGALDRFSQFFIAPLFHPSGVEREMLAVDQEFHKDLPLDQWRIFHVKKELAHPEHPFHLFSIGNLETLGKISQDELKEWYHTHYSANIMRLVVYSSLPLESLEKEVVTFFSPVKDLGYKPSIPSFPLLTSETIGKILAIDPIQEIQLLELSWELPSHFGRDRETQPDKLVSHVLSHEGESSLLAQLKREKLAENLAASSFKAGKDQSLFSISIELTSEGIEKYEKVIERCFEALASLKKSPIHKYIYDEVGKMAEIHYTYQSREEIFQYVTELAYLLGEEPLDTFPKQSVMATRYDPTMLSELLGYLSPQSCHFTLVASPELTKIQFKEKEKWMGVPYTVLAIPKEKIAQWDRATPHQAIFLPSPNPFIPKQLCLLDKSLDKKTSLPTPLNIEANDFGKVYFYPDTRFGLPQIAWIFNLKTPVINDADPKSQILADFYCYAVKQKLNTVAYEAELGGLKYSLDPSHFGLLLKLKGFDNKASEFLVTILETLKCVKPTVQEFARYKEMYQREYANEAHDAPVKECLEFLSSILYKNYCGVCEKENGISSVTFEEFQKFCDTLWKESHIEGVFCGNQTKEMVFEMWEKMHNLIQTAPFPPKKHPHLAVADLSSLKEPSYLEKKSHLPGNSLILAIDGGAFSFKKRAAQEVLSKGLEEPFFSELRTRQQTAYLVKNWSSEVERHQYFFFAIQSSSHASRDLLARFELFFETSLRALSATTIPKERFESIRTALIETLENRIRNLNEMSEVLYTLAFDYDGSFDWYEKRIQGLREISYEEFVEFSKEILGKENRGRIAVCIDGSSSSTTKTSYRKISNPKKVAREVSYNGRF